VVQHSSALDQDTQMPADVKQQQQALCSIHKGCLNSSISTQQKLYSDLRQGKLSESVPQDLEDLDAETVDIRQWQMNARGVLDSGNRSRQQQQHIIASTQLQLQQHQKAMQYLQEQQQVAITYGRDYYRDFVQGRIQSQQQFLAQGVLHLQELQFRLEHLNSLLASAERDINLLRTWLEVNLDIFALLTDWLSQAEQLGPDHPLSLATASKRDFWLALLRPKTIPEALDRSTAWMIPVYE